jgi:hypothetical protein
MAGNGDKGRDGSATAQRTAGVVVPDGVELSENSLRRVYTYETEAGNALDFTINNKADDSLLPDRLLGRQFAEVEFSVNGEYTSIPNAVSRREGTAIALRSLAIMRADAASRPDGFQYITTATSGDGLGSRRASLYARAGFSGNFPGLPQVAHVVNGRLVPGLAEN